jgi:hypothetical protein
MTADVWQNSYMKGDVGITWNSANGMYSASDYIGNIFDTEYKNGVGIGTGSTENTDVTMGNPQVWGLSLTLRF